MDSNVFVTAARAWTDYGLIEDKRQIPARLQTRTAHKAGFFAPQILKAAGGLEDSQVGFAVALPYAGAALAMFFWSRHSDVTSERIWHVALPTLLAATGFVLAGQSQSLEIALLAFLRGRACLLDPSRGVISRCRGSGRHRAR
jgi:MFS family permease